jgi:3-phosphoshikimate 1-carboxyvinyltransferase
VSAAAVAVVPLTAPPDATVRVPGSKSLTNRALVCAALAPGRSTIRGALVADDTEAMAGCLRALGSEVRFDGDVVDVDGAGRPAVAAADLDCRLSGTTARFVLPVAALGHGTYRLDGAPPLRRRPMGPVVEAVREMGGHVDGDALPLTVRASGLRGGAVAVRADASSQFVSGLLLAGSLCDEGLVVEVLGEPVSRPYLHLTVAVMRAFGAAVAVEGDARFAVDPVPYRPASYDVEPDASAAAYLWAAAALTGGRVTVDGLGSATAQGDARILDVLERMGASVIRTAWSTTVEGRGSLAAVDVDLRDLPDQALTVAVLGAFADGPTRVRGVDVIRGHETDRIRAVVSELGRAGIRAEETADGFVVHPGQPRPATIETYDDHRMAMAFALLGLRAQGIRIADPGCVAKTFPSFWEVIDSLRER